MTTFINVNKHRIGSNARHGTNYPPIGVRHGRSGKAEYTHRVEVDGPCFIIHSPEKPLKCGAKVWIETDAPVGYVKEE